MTSIPQVRDAIRQFVIALAKDRGKGRYIRTFAGKQDLAEATEAWYRRFVIPYRERKITDLIEAERREWGYYLSLYLKPDTDVDIFLRQAAEILVDLLGRPDVTNTGLQRRGLAAFTYLDVMPKYIIQCSCCGCAMLMEKRDHNQYCSGCVAQDEVDREADAAEEVSCHD